MIQPICIIKINYNLFSIQSNIENANYKGLISHFDKSFLSNLF